MRNISSLADYFVIATGNNNTHVRALADELEEKLKGEGLPPARVEGYRSNSWILLDWGNVVIHIFTQEGRDFYDLDHLWADGGNVEWSRVGLSRAGFLRSPRPGRPLRSERRAFSPAARGETGPRETKTALGKGAKFAVKECTAYHVVTERPMTVGQVLCLDETYPAACTAG